MANPSAFAALRLTAKSKTVGSSTGKSLGFVPLRILSRAVPNPIELCSIGKQSAKLDEFPDLMRIWNAMLYPKIDDPFPLEKYERISNAQKGVRSIL